MKTWYRAVCDDHKEMIDIFVSNPGCTAHYLSGFDRDIQEWLSQHYVCELRFVHRDEQLDKLWDTHLDMSKAFVEDRKL